ncbi:MAG: hypothetical protein P1U36_06230 [Legionellaceae bacterium]|nr:hypothetical protein [Legionellaceae bacterium]
MRNIVMSSLLALFVSSSYPAYADINYGVHEENPYHFDIKKDIHPTAEVYRINSKLRETYAGSIKKSAFRIRTNYDLSNEHGWQATGITRIVSIGSLFSWAKDIDIYDTRRTQIGMIDGELATLEAAKFSIYEYSEKGEATRVAIAYANADFKRFIVLAEDTNINPVPIAELNRTEPNNWHVSVNYPDKIDDRIIRIFAGFVVDYQDKFL